MRSRWLGAVIAAAVLFASHSAAHPASGIVVNAKGEVFFIHTGRGVAKIDADGKLTYVHTVKGGGHFLAVDAEAKYASQFPRLFERITPEGVKPALLYASGGGPFVVTRSSLLYYGSGYPGGDDTAPGGLTLTRMTPDGKRSLFAPELKPTLEKLKEAICGLAEGPDGSLIVACPAALLKVKADGTVSTLVHPIEVTDCDDVFTKARGKEGYSESPFFHPPYLRGVDLASDGTIYAAATGCRCVVRIAKEGKVETVLKAEEPWTPTGVAVNSMDLFVLEYAHHDATPEKWTPRVRKLGADGKIVILADLSRGEKRPER